MLSTNGCTEIFPFVVLHRSDLISPISCKGENVVVHRHYIRIGSALYEHNY